MSASTKPFLVGILVGVAAGVGGTLYLEGRDAGTPGPSQPRPATAPERPAGPHGTAMPSDAPHGAGDGHEATFAKIHFMRKFTAALAQPPENLMPVTEYQPLIKEGAARIRCADCHTDPSLDMEAMIRNDPGEEAAQPFRMQRRRLMIPLMEKWVARLNKLHAERLRKEVTCTDCHAADPRDDQARTSALAPLMIRFVKALKAPPENANPAPGWQPLLKDPATPSMLCGSCHGQVGTSMEKNIAGLDGPSPAIAGENHAFMVTLMERWTTELNKRAKNQLVKAVVCTDCHETDPRK